jgi:hypothetical protein
MRRSFRTPGHALPYSPNSINMNRRIAIRNLVLLSAGATLLDACGTKETMAYRNISLTGGQQDMLAELTEAIIPRTTDFMGAKDLKSSEFTLLMVDDCGSPEEQAAFLNGMQQFNDACISKTGSGFVSATKEQRDAFMNALEVKERNDQPENVVKFYRGVKHATIQSFMTSEEYLTKVENFSLIPPKFQACVPVETV